MRLGVCGGIVCAAVVAGMLSGMPPHSSAGVAAPGGPKGVIDGTQFQRLDITIKEGDTVEWENRDPFPHTATASDGAFDSKEIAPGKTWSYTAKVKGDIAYFCTLHPTMKGVIRVQ